MPTLLTLHITTKVWLPDFIPWYRKTKTLQPHLPVVKHFDMYLVTVQDELTDRQTHTHTTGLLYESYLIGI
jgi:hypothetical protein